MSGWTFDDLARIGKARVSTEAAGASAQKRAKFTRHTFHRPGIMNKTEAEYAERLESLKLAGEISDYRFECVKFKLADKTFYTPDFMVLRPDGTFELHEVKGFWEDDARVKIKVAAAQYPFKFIAARKVKGAWETEEF